MPTVVRVLVVHYGGYSFLMQPVRSSKACHTGSEDDDVRCSHQTNDLDSVRSSLCPLWVSRLFQSCTQLGIAGHQACEPCASSSYRSIWLVVRRRISAPSR